MRVFSIVRGTDGVTVACSRTGACTHNAAHNFVYGPDNPPLAYGCRVLDDLKANASESGWHVWALDWTPSKLSIFVDSVEIFYTRRLDR